MERDGAAGPNSVKWVSKYGSVVASGYDVSTTDGINEKGLSANLLWLVESVYPTPESNKPTLSISAWAQYVLDNYATVEEAVTALEKEPFAVITDKVRVKSAWRHCTFHYPTLPVTAPLLNILMVSR